MSTIASTVFAEDSDSENDPDFMPDERDESGSEGRRDEEKHEKERDSFAMTEAEKLAAEKEKQERESLWAEFQASVAGPSTSRKPEAASKRLVKIEKHYRFAGEDVVEVVEVLEDSEDAKKWPLWRPNVKAGTQTDAGLPNPIPAVDEASAPVISDLSAETTREAPTPTSQNTTATNGLSKRPRPGPRKPKTALPELSSAVGKKKTLTTIEKSAMDWKAHVAAEGDVQDELARNRRAGGGGYLEKVQFMERVGSRREEIFEREKGSKRRKV